MVGTIVLESSLGVARGLGHLEPDMPDMRRQRVLAKRVQCMQPHGCRQDASLVPSHGSPVSSDLVSPTPLQTTEDPTAGSKPLLHPILFHAPILRHLRPQNVQHVLASQRCRHCPFWFLLSLPVCLPACPPAWSWKQSSASLNLSPSPWYNAHTEQPCINILQPASWLGRASLFLPGH